MAPPSIRSSQTSKNPEKVRGMIEDLQKKINNGNSSIEEIQDSLAAIKE